MCVCGVSVDTQIHFPVQQYYTKTDTRVHLATEGSFRNDHRHDDHMVRSRKLKKCLIPIHYETLTGLHLRAL